MLVLNLPWEFQHFGRQTPGTSQQLQCEDLKECGVPDSQTMLPLQQNRDEELNAFQLTALSLSIGAKATKQNYPPTLIENRFQEESSENASSPENQRQLHGGLTRTKKRRSLDNGELTLGSGSSSSRLRMNGMHSFAAGSRLDRSECSGSRLNQIDNVPSRFSCENGTRSTSCASEVNDVSKSCPYQQPVNGRSCEKGSEISAYGRASEPSVADKVRSRMIKNRESAARSRARKQALEAQQQLEITELKKENNSLKGLVRFLLAIVMTKQMKTPALSRSFSATF